MRAPAGAALVRGAPGPEPQCVYTVCVTPQGFNWECAHRPQPAWYAVLAGRAAEMGAAGITAVWLPPPCASVTLEVMLLSM